MPPLNRTRDLRPLVWLLGLALGLPVARADDKPPVSFARDGDRLEIEVGGKPLATYVFRDEKVLRPYFAHLHAPGGIPVSRRFPPVAGSDPVDHPTMHPGLWLAFGDINGADFWRNKGRVEHERFVDPPRGGAGEGTFAVRNRYVTQPGETPVCEETCRVTILARPAGILFVIDSELGSDVHDLAFGAQEEMGLGVRVATPIAAKQGGRLLSSDGGVGEAQVWGKHANWVDDSGTIDGQAVGVTLMPDPATFGQGWFHVRDYGLMVANPIERSEKKNGEPAKRIVARGESARFRFGVLLHSGPAANDEGLKAAYQDFLREIREPRGPRQP
jgi:hypothetical protein